MKQQAKVLRRREVEAMAGVCHQTIWRWERAGSFPRRIQLGQHSVGWLESEVEQWLADRAGARAGRG